MKNSVLITAIALLLLSCSANLNAQGTAINSTGANPDNSAMLDVSSTNKGMLVPRMTLSQRNSINSPSNGLMIFNTDCNNFNYYNGVSWTFINSTNTLSSPGIISGSNDVCSGQTAVSYSIQAVSGATGYNWLLPSGASVASGAGTNSITVNYGSNGGTVCVTANDSCGSSSSSCINITLSTATPAAPAASGATGVSQTQFIANWGTVAGASHYHLDVASDAGFTSILPGYNNISVGNNTSYTVGGLNCSSAYYFRVTAENGCGASAVSNTVMATTSACVTSSCNGSWEPKEMYPGLATNLMAGFVIGTKAYVGTGNGASLCNDFWVYDQANDSWTQIADFVDARCNAIGFAANGKGYVGTGTTPGFKKKDLYEYDPVANTWTAKASMPAAAKVREKATAFSINNKGYVGTGEDNAGTLLKDFWEYNPSTDSWLQVADFPSTSNTSLSFVIGTKGYVFYTNNIYEYNPSTNIWTMKTSPGFSTSSSVVFSLSNGMGYLALPPLAGTPPGPIAVLEYNPTSDLWKYLYDFPYGYRYSSKFSFSIGNNGYFIGGSNPYSRYTKELWEFCP